MGNSSVLPCMVLTIVDATLMIPAKLRCPDSWTKEYSGYLMAEKEMETKAEQGTFAWITPRKSSEAERPMETTSSSSASRPSVDHCRVPATETAGTAHVLCAASERSIGRHYINSYLLRHTRR